MTDLFNGVKGLTDFRLKASYGTTSDALIVLPTPTGLTFNPGVTELIQRANSRIGESVVVNRVNQAVEPTLTTTFPALTPGVLSVRLNRALTVGAVSGNYVETFRLGSSHAVVAATSGQHGFGVVANPAGSQAAMLKPDGTSFQLTFDNDYSTFDGAVTADSFAIDANGAIAFSETIDGIDSENQYITVDIPLPHTSIVSLDSVPYTDLSLIFNVIDISGKIGTGVLTGIQPIQSEGEISFAGGEIPITWSINYDGSQCSVFGFHWTDQVRVCR